jgi:hypothetical protein
LTQVDVEDALTCDQHQHEAKEYPSTETVGEVSVLPTALVLVDVAHGKHVQLLLTSAASNVDREQDWHGNAGTDKHNNHSHAKKSEKEVRIQRLVLERIGIWDLPERANPVEPSCGESF